MYELRRIVSLSPNLESVEIEQGNFGCLIRSHSNEEKAEMEKLGALFATSEPSQNNIKSLRSRGGNHIDMLEDVTDMRKLESLDMDEIYVSALFPPWPFGKIRFESLKHLSLQMGFWYDPRYERRSLPPHNSIQDFLARCSPLESLHLTDRRGRVDLSTILDNHGPTLRKLHLHDSEQVIADGAPNYHSLSLEEIREVRKRCPELKEFTADLKGNRSWDWTKEILEELARFEKVQKLTLYLPLGLADISFPSCSKPPFALGVRDPLLSAYVPADTDTFNFKQVPSRLENIYSFLLHQKKINKGVPLKELRITLGEWERQPPMGLAAGWECFEGRNKRCFILTRSQRDDCSDMVEIRTLRLDDINDENSVKEERVLRKIPDWET
jgi:hypothetical protein